MSKPDDNFISFTGDAAGNIWRNGALIFTPAHSRSQRIWTERQIVVPADRQIADVLKFSGVRGLTVLVRGILPGGYEDCIDINNHCADVEVDLEDGALPVGDYFATIKGGSRDIVISGKLWAPAKTVDVDLGNLSDQSDDITRGVTLHLAMMDGSRVTYRQLNASAPTLSWPDDYRRTFRLRGIFRSLFAKGAALLKKLNIIR